MKACIERFDPKYVEHLRAARHWPKLPGMLPTARQGAAKMKPCVTCKRSTGASAILKPKMKEVPLCPSCYQAIQTGEPPKKKRKEAVWKRPN